MAVKFQVSFLVMALCCSMVNSRCPNNRCHSTHLKFGGRIRMSSVGNSEGGTPSLVIMQLPRKSTKLLRTTAGSIYVRQKSDECQAPDSERNFVCPAPLNEERPCADAQLPCNHNYHPPAFNGSDILTLTNVNDTAVTVTWRDWDESSDLGYGPVSGYKIEYREKDSRSFIALPKLEKNITSSRVTGLQPGTHYEFRLIIAGDGIFPGYGPPTDVYRVRTDCRVPKTPTLNRQSNTKNSVTFSIEIPTASDWSCRNASAYIQNLDNQADRHSVNLSTTNITIETLTPCTTYRYRLKIKAEGKNAKSEDQSFTTSPEDPEPPRLTIGSVNSSAVNIDVHFPNIETWNCGNRSIELYQNDKKIRDIDTPNEAETSIIVAELEPCKDYIYQLQLTDGDDSVLSNVKDVSTAVIAPSSPPVNVRQKQRLERKLKFVWEMPTSDCRCCGEFISNYSYVLLENNKEVRRNVTVDNNVEFNELIPYTTYSFKVKASTSGGDSDYSSHVEETTLEDSPPKMSIVEPELLNATTLKITWSPPSPPHGIIIGYHLRYRLNEENQTWTDKYIDGQSENVHYIRVNPDSNYAFQIRANTSVGYGEWSDERNETTAERAPGPPAAGNVTEKSEKWVIVRWDKPQITNGVIIKYEISWRTLKSPNGKVLSKNLTVNASIHQVNISSLTPSSLYEIQIAGYTSAGRGDVFIFNVSTKVTTELKPIKTKEVSVKRSTTKKGFEITLPPLTQEYATNYVIVIRISIKKYEVLAELNKSNHDVTFSLTEEKLKEYGFDEDSNPAILIGVKSTCGEETTVIWSDVIEIPVNVSITKNNLFIIIIVSCVAFSILFILIAFTSFMICRHFRDEWRYNKTQFEDDSAYLALERKHSSTSDRYMELNIKDQGEKKLPSVSSVSKIKVESGETEVNYSGFIETGEDVLATTDDLILLGSSDVSANKKTSMGTFREPSSANSHTTVDGSAGNANSQMTSSELTGEMGQLATENKFANNPAVQRAVERFKAGTVPQLYNTEIYDQSSEARLMNSKISKTNGRSAGPIVITKDGKVIRQSYDKVIVTDLSSEMAGHPTDVIPNIMTGNTAFTGSYIDPDEVNSEKNHWGNTKDVSLKGNRGGNQRASYVEVDETGRISNKRDLRSSYLSLDEEAMSRDKQASVSPSKPSYIELDAEAMKTDKDNLQTTSGTPYLELDEQAMTNDKSDTVAGVKASYIELDEKAMSEDKDKLISNPRASYFEVGGQTVKTNKGDATYSSKAAYIEVDEIGMAEGKDETLASSRVSYFEVDDRGIKRKKEGGSINSKAYIELDEQAMKTEALSPKQNPGPSYLTIEEEGIKRNRDATISSKSSYIELDDHAMTRDAKLASLRASYMELDKDGITSLRERENSSRYKELKKGRLPSGKVQNNVLARVQEDDAPFNQPHNTASDVKLDEIYHEPKRQYSARRPYEDKILEQHLPNTANPMTRHQNSVKYEACVPIGSSDVGDDMYDENVVDGYSRSRSDFGVSHHADRNQRISSYDGSIFRPSNVEERQDNEGIYFHADETDEMSSFHGGYETENTISPEQDESFYDETTVPEVMQGESQSIYEEIPAERAAFQKQKQASILQSFKTKVGWSGAMRSAKRSPLPALPANGKTNSSSSMFEPILEGQADDTYEVLPGEKVMGQKHN